MYYDDYVPVDELEWLRDIPVLTEDFKFVRLGWIGSQQDFCTAIPDVQFVARLWDVCRAPAVQVKGYSSCCQCGSRWGPTSITFNEISADIGDGFIIVEVQPGIFLLAQDLIYHY